jgi:pantoate--beta-alanine ligase
VSKLLNIVQPDRLYLGQKDAQQVAVIERMVKDLNVPLTLKTVPTVRDPDGVAMSSRNAYLSDEHRREAVWLYKSLQHAKRSILDGERRSRRVEEQIKKMIEKNTSGKVEYIHCVKYNSLESADHLEGPTLIALAVCFGRARLIDNIIVRVT